MAAGIRLFDGSKWVTVGGDKSRVWDGSKWVSGKSRLWDGSKWISVGLQRYTKEYSAVWSEGFWGPTRGNLSHTHYNSLVRHDRLTQGNYLPYHDSWIGRNGRESGMFGIDIDAFRRDLQGAKIESISVYYHVIHSGYSNGTELVVGTHNCKNWQDVFHESNHAVAKARYYKRDQGQWINLPVWVGNNLRDGLLCGLTTYSNATDLWHYCYCAGVWDGWKKPKIRVTYTK